MTASSRSAEILPRFYDLIPPSSMLRLSPKKENFAKTFKVQKVITLEDPPSASRSRPAGRERRPSAGLFSPRTLKYFQSPKGDPTGRSLVRRCFSTERGQRDPRPPMVLDRTRPNRPSSADGSRPSVTKETLVRGCFSTERGQRDPRPAFSSTVTSLPPERGDHSRKCQVRGCVPYSPRERIRDRRVVLDRPVEKYRDRRLFRSDTFFKKFSKSKR